MERPTILYHASPDKNIDELEPRNKTVRDPNEGPVLFAARDKAAAMKNLFESNDSWTHQAKVNGVHVMLIAQERDKFIASDKGGACYELSGEQFFCDSSKKPLEWTSKTNVKPLSKEVFGSALDAMIDHGVQVYFVDEFVLEEFRHADDKVAVLKKLTSENQMRGLDAPSFIF